MLGKLIKQEFRATGRILWPMYLALVVISVCANGSVRLLGTSESWLLNIFGALIIGIFALGIFAVCIMTLVLMINRFRTNLLGDEGYVMFTLPASVHQQVWSKIIVSVVWFLATAAVVVLSALIVAFRVEYVRDFVEMMQDLLSQFTAYYAFNGAAFLVELLILCFVAVASCCLEFYAAMSVGYSFANHKGLLSVAFFFAFQFVMQFLGLTSLFSFDGFHIADTAAAVHAVLWLGIGAALVEGAVFYVITTFMLKSILIWSKLKRGAERARSALRSDAI